jgi:hypothetical protein
MTHYLRFESEESAIQHFEVAGFVQDEILVLNTHKYSLDIIGQIIRGGEWDAEGNVITPPEVLEGWHANYQGDLPEELIPFLVEPENPVRMFYI